MDRGGFEPPASAARGPKNVTSGYEMRIENSENRRIIDDFADFMRVDLRLKEVTITDHLSCMDKFFDGEETAKLCYSSGHQGLS